MRQRIRYLSVIAGILAASSVSSSVMAQGAGPSGTIVEPGTIEKDVIWNREGSPYMLTGTVQIAGHSLTIKPGTRVTLAPNHEEFTALVVSDGSVNIEGSKDNRIKIDSLSEIRFLRSPTHIAYADLSRILFDTYINASSVSIASSSFTDSQGVGLQFRNVNADIVDSLFKGNGFAGLTVSPDVDDRDQVIKIRNSSFVDNRFYSIRNTAPYINIDAESNWWGKGDGPDTKDGFSANVALGTIDFEPWLSAEPFSIEARSLCCSSILFLPGIEGSRLFNSSNMLWEPLGNPAVKALYLNADGSSKDASIYSGGPIDRAFGTVDVYGRFLEYLDGLKKDGLINNWKAFGYDWRRSIDKVVDGPEQKSANTESLIETVEGLAKDSKTGKVTLIGHSNGGLIGEMLVKRLTDMGRQNLIDSVISVAVPFFGTPEAIYALLHGGNQAVLGGLIVSSSAARGLSQNMASAYSLLPSEGYFKSLFSPTIAFASTTMPGLNDGSYPQTVDSFQAQDHFIKDANNARKAPAFSDTNSPLVGNEALTLASTALHSVLDNFIWPGNIARYAIVGWNAFTNKGLVYELKKSCQSSILGVLCKDKIKPMPKASLMGDGTVIAKSAVGDPVSTISLDLGQISDIEKDKVRHMDILESSTTESIIERAIKNSEKGGRFELPPGASWGEPDYSKEPDSYILSTHSPVELHVYDEKGNHTGLLPKPAGLAGNDFILGAYEEGIPKSDMRVMGTEDGNETFIYLPAGNGQRYSVEIRGTGVGFATFDALKMRSGEEESRVEYSLFPVTPLSVATTSFADSLPVSLNIDADGDHKTDFIIKPNPGALPDVSLYRRSLKLYINKLSKDDSRKKDLIRQLDSLKDLKGDKGRDEDKDEDESSEPSGRDREGGRR